MNLQTTVSIYCDDASNAIAKTANRVFTKKVGKPKGLDAIEKQIREQANTHAEEVSGQPIDTNVLDEYVGQRLDYLTQSFTKLNNPKTVKTQRRMDLIGDTESDGAKWFGKTKGHEALGKEVYKVWVVVDPCDTCAGNEAEGPIPIDETFPSGDYAPLAHPGCQCTLEYVDEHGDPLDDEE